MHTYFPAASRTPRGAACRPPWASCPSRAPRACATPPATTPRRRCRAPRPTGRGSTVWPSRSVLSPAARCPLTGETSRPWRCATPPPACTRCSYSTASSAPPQASTAGISRPLSGPDQQPAVGASHAYAPPLRAHARVDHGHAHAHTHTTHTHTHTHTAGPTPNEAFETAARCLNRHRTGGKVVDPCQPCPGPVRTTDAGFRRPSTAAFPPSRAATPGRRSVRPARARC